MAEQKPQTSTSPARSELEKVVKQMIMLSIGLKFEEKNDLITKLPSLKESQLNQLKEVFEAENQRKEKILGDFFSEHPELYSEFERFSKDHVNQIFSNVEESEQVKETEKMQELLSTSY